LTSFTAKYLQWPTLRSTLINTAYFGSLCVGRIIGVPLSVFIKPQNVVTINLVLVFISTILFLFSPMNDMMVWISAGLMGLGLATTVGAMFLWLSEISPVTRLDQAITGVTGAAGGMFGTFTVGQLFVLYTPMSLAYMLVASSSLMLLIFFILLILGRLFRRRQRRLIKGNVLCETKHLS